MSLSVHFLLHFLGVHVVGIVPFEGIDDFAASLASVLVSAIIVHRNSAGVGVAPLPSVYDDVAADEALEEALVEITMGELTKMVGHLVLIETAVVNLVLKNFGQLGLCCFSLTFIGDIVSHESSEILFLGEVADDGMLFHIIHILHQFSLCVAVEIVTATTRVGNRDVVIRFDVSVVIGDYRGQFAELAFTGCG